MQVLHSEAIASHTVPDAVSVAEGNTVLGAIARPSATLAKLRALAEERLKVNQSSTPDYSVQPEEILRINHELAIHQIELEMQHDELLQSRAELEKVLVFKF